MNAIVLKTAQSPLIHFLLIGLLVFAWLGTDETVATVEPLTEQEVKLLASQWQRQQGVAIDDQTLSAMMREQLLERVLVAEAINRGFHRQDSVVRQRLVLNMQFIDSDNVGSDEQSYIDQAIALGMVQSDLVVRRRLVQLLEQNLLLGESFAVTDEAIEQYYRQHQSEFLKVSKIALEQLFFSADKPAAFQRASTTLAALANGAEPMSLDSDMFIHGRHFALQSEQQYQRLLGANFAAAIESLTLSQWSKPIESSFGWHLVRLEQRIGEQQKSLAAVRGEVADILQRQWHEQRLHEKKQALLQHYGYQQ